MNRKHALVVSATLLSVAAPLAAQSGKFEFQITVRLGDVALQGPNRHKGRFGPRRTIKSP